MVDYGSDFAQRLGTAIDPQAYAEYGQQRPDTERFGSFAPPRQGNDVKWYVDGCSYFYAVSRAFENAKESIWILDCESFFFMKVVDGLWLTYIFSLGWLSPELYLRRPPAKNEQYRLDRMLQAAAQRGVRVNIIVYKEVTQALTRIYISDPSVSGRYTRILTCISIFRSYKAPFGRPSSQHRGFPSSRPSSWHPRVDLLHNLILTEYVFGCCFSFQDARRCPQGIIRHER